MLHEDQRLIDRAGDELRARVDSSTSRPSRKDDTAGEQARGYLGHLDPKTGKVEEFQSPGGPRGGKPARSKNVLVLSRERMGWGGGTVRNMDIDKSGNLWLAESGVGKIARVTIRRTTTTQ